MLRIGTHAHMLALFLYMGAVFGDVSVRVLTPNVRALGVPF
jgi:hypothetical protein